MKKIKHKNIVVIGCGRYGSSLAQTLSGYGAEVLVIDSDKYKIQEITPFVTKAVVADATDEMVLRDLGINNMDVVVVAIGSNIEASIMTTLLAKDMEAKYVICKASNNKHAKVLEKIGADKIVFPEKDMAIKTAKTLISPDFMELIELEKDYNIAETKIPVSWIGKSIIELDLRRKYSINVIGILRNGKLTVNIDPNIPLEEDQRMFVVGKMEDIMNISEK